jgi:hypothetical protein
MSNRNLRRIHTTVSAQTLYHLENMRKFSGYKDIGQVIDKLVREKTHFSVDVYSGGQS